MLPRPTVQRGIRIRSRLLCVLIVLVAGVPGLAQEPRQVPAGAVITSTEPPVCASRCGGLNCCRWTLGCFPRWGCPDDYSPNPYPRQCWPPYPPFYQCVPAGDCAPCCRDRGKDRLTWWFIPTPRALREAFWCQP